MSSSLAPTHGSARVGHRLVPISVLILVIITMGLRLWQLNTVPSGLWWDEATQGLDAAELLHGKFRIFYPSALGKEPLYIYLTAPFVAAWGGQPFAVRIAGALFSVLTVPALYGCGRALFPDTPAAGAWAGLAAALLWATNFWVQSISRIGFQVNAFPLIVTVAVLMWLNYVRRPGRGRAIAFGAVAGLTLYTYLAARFTPALWLVLFVLLPRARQRAMRATLAHAVITFVAAALPLGVYFALHPADFVSRISTFGIAQGSAAVVKPETLEWATRLTFEAFLGMVGDPIARHNLPNEPSFTVVTSILFGLGLVIGLLAIILRRHQGALTVIVWWVLLCIPAILSRSSTPHYPRLFGALPAAMLIAALPIGFSAQALYRVRPRAAGPVLGVLLAALLVFETANTAQAYFVRWARETDLYTFFQQDLWTVGEKVKNTPGALGVVALNEGYGKQLDYVFADTPIYQLPATETDVAGWLAAHLGDAGGRDVISVSWGQGANQDADPGQLLQYYLAREGELVGDETHRGFDLKSFRLGEHPQFDAPGQAAAVHASFESGVTLEGARWGAAYPNPDRNADTAVAGTPLWAVLEWRLDSAQPYLQVAVDLLDAAGHRLASTEAPLMDLRAAAGPWTAGDSVQTYHQLTIPGTYTPGQLMLAARVYNTKTGAPILLQEPQSTLHDAVGPSRLRVSFAQPQAAQPNQPPSPAMAKKYDQELGAGVTLLGADEWAATVRPGDKFTVRLYWQVNEPSEQSRPVQLNVEGPQPDNNSAANALVEIPGGLTVPAIIHTEVDLVLHADATPGRYVIALQDGARERFELGSVEVVGRSRTWEAPLVAQELAVNFGTAVVLAGVDAPSVLPVASGQAVTVMMVWRVLQSPGGALARFLHVLGPDGRPIAQRAGLPCAGWDAAGPEAACPSTSWLTGETLIDPVVVVLPADLPQGRYPLATGWYDPVTLERLPAYDAVGARVPDDIFRLPVELVVSGGG